MNEAQSPTRFEQALKAATLLLIILVIINMALATFNFALSHDCPECLNQNIEPVYINQTQSPLILYQNIYYENDTRYELIFRWQFTRMDNGSYEILFKSRPYESTFNITFDQYCNLNDTTISRGQDRYFYTNSDRCTADIIHGPFKVAMWFWKDLNNPDGLYTGTATITPE